MVRRFLGVLVLAFVAAGATPRGAHEQFGFVGILVTVDLPKNRLVLEYKENGKPERVRLVLTPKTQITNKDKQKVPRTALKTGLTAVVQAYGDDDAPELETLSIRIVPPIAK